MGINKKDVGLRIRSIRKDKGMTLDDFGDLLTPPASDSIVSRWERGVSLPSNERTKQIAKEGNVSVDELLYGSLDDYARRLLEELEEELQEDESIKKGVIPLIISDIESRLFPKFFPRDSKDKESLELEFTKYKEDAIKLWTNSDYLDVEIVNRIGRQLSSTITDNLKYFYSDFYDNDDNHISSGDKISERSDEFIKRLHGLDNFNRSYIDSLRFLDDDDMVKELDKIKLYIETLNKLNGLINLNEL